MKIKGNSKIYYRSDRRPYSEIFKLGFVPRITHNDIDNRKWWENAIRAEKYTNNMGIKVTSTNPVYRSADVDANVAVCMSTRLESAAIFPWESGTDEDVVSYKLDVKEERNSENLEKSSDEFSEENALEDFKHLDNSAGSEKFEDFGYAENFEPREYSERSEESDEEEYREFYIYALALPSEVKLQLNENGSVALEGNENYFENDKREIIDLHSLQTQQAKNIIDTHSKFFSKNIDKLCLHAGNLLYAYEAIAYSIPRNNIICAIRCVAKTRKKNLIALEELSYDSSIKPENKYEENFISGGFEPTYSEQPLTDRDFTIEEVIENPYFSSTETLKLSSGASMIFDYSESVKEVYEQIEQLKDEDKISTTNLFHGLGGKTF